MTVADLKEEIEAVCDALQFSVLGCSCSWHRAIFDQSAYADIAMLGEKPTIEQQQDMIHAWCNRLYVANQCAYIFTYAHHPECNRKINFISDRDHCHHGAELIQNPARLYRTLEYIKYNLYSNGGQCMFSGEDMARLDELIALIARDIVGEYQRGKVPA